MSSPPACLPRARRKFNFCFTWSPAKKIHCKKKMRLWLRNSNISLEARTGWSFFRHVLITALVLAFSASLAHALDPNLLLSQYMFHPWATDKAFPAAPPPPPPQPPPASFWLRPQKGFIPSPRSPLH